MKKLHLLVIANLFIGTVNLHGMEKQTEQKKSPIARLQSLATALVTRSLIQGHEKNTAIQIEHPAVQNPANARTSAPIDIKSSHSSNDGDLQYESDSSGFSSKDSSYVKQRGGPYIEDFYGAGDQS